MSTSKASFIYVIYINASPEKVWDALTNADITQQYWFNRRNESDWKPGSAWQHVRADGSAKVDCVGKVVESNPPHKLVVSWANPADASNPVNVSRVTYEIKTHQDATCLTVRHDELEQGSKMHEGISNGWPCVLSSLKTYLETGKVMAMAATCGH